MEKKDQAKQSSQLPIKEKIFTQSLEEMKLLIPHIKDKMSSCPKDDITFILYEKVDYYSLTRNFSLKSKTEQNNNNAINKFKDILLTDLASYESFIPIPESNSFEIQVQSNKGKQFKAPKVYDINGEEANIITSSGIILLFFYDNLTDLKIFIAGNKNTTQKISCIAINVNLFEAKRWIKNSGLLNNIKFFFYFTEISPKSLNSVTNIKINSLPRVAIIFNGLIDEDKSIKNINTFDILRDLINNIGQTEYSNDVQAKIDKFVYLENEVKKNLVKSMNIYMKKNGFNDVHFYVKSKISIDKNGIKKIRCYPIFYGEANISAKSMIDNLITILNGQHLFYDIQCKVNYNN